MTSFNRNHRHNTSNHPDKIQSESLTTDNDSSSQSLVLQMQALIGNKAVQRMFGKTRIQREEPSAPAAENYSLRDWPKALTTVKRTKEQRITKVKDKAELNVPDVDMPELTPAQSEIVKQIKQNRAGLSPALEKLALVPYKQEKEAGYFYNGAASNKMKAQDAAGTDEKRKKVMDAIRTEIGREGGWSAVNTYDDAVVTLGRGFTRSLLAQVMQTFFALDPDAKNTFLDLGITWSGGTARVVNTATGGIEEGDNALHLIQLEPAILSVFVKMAESEEHGHKLIAAQEAHTMPYKVPQAVVDNWQDMMAVRLVAHLIHWRSAKQWADYAGCNGDVRQILLVAKSIINKGKQDATKYGAYITTAEQANVLFSFAEGKAKEGVTGPYDLPPLEEDALKDDLLLDAGDGKKFYSTVRLGTSQ